jgi:hypothetical protein
MMPAAVVCGWSVGTASSCGVRGKGLGDRPKPFNVTRLGWQASQAKPPADRGSLNQSPALSAITADWFNGTHPGTRS